MDYKSKHLIKLLWGFSAYQFLLHLFFLIKFADLRLIIPTTISFIHDVFLLTIFYLIAVLILKVLPGKTKLIAEGVLIFIFISLGSLLSVYPKLLREYLIFPVNIFESDISITRTLITDYLGFSAFIPAFFAIVLGLILIKIKKNFTIPRKLSWLGIIIVIILSVFFLQKISPNPFIYSFQSEIESIIKNEKRIVPSLILYGKAEFGKISTLDYPPGEIKNYKNIIIVVLEGVTANDFENEFMEIKGGFFESNKNKSVYYNNYYASNLDSYTSLIAMMTGIQVPYRSYSDPNIYEKVNYEPNLVEYFNQKGFTSSFISTFEYQPFIPSQESWNNIFARKDLSDIDKWVSVGSSKMEMATEDKVAITKIVSEVKRNDKNFVLHELVYGHSPEWRATTGKTQLVYYDEYLKDLSDKLRENNILDNTLFVIVSDHGDRARAADVENYRIPLLIMGENSSNGINNIFLSHLDLPKIIYSFLQVGGRLAGSDMIFTVGSSEKWTYGVITKDKNYVFIDNAKGTIISRLELDPVAVSKSFQEYINGFNEKYGNSK